MNDTPKSGSETVDDTLAGEKGTPDGQDNAKGEAPQEVGGRKGPEPTRYGDWEKNGIISDF